MDPHRDYDDCEDGHDDGGDGHDEEQRTKEQPIAADEGSGADTTIREPADETPIAKADPVVSLTKMFCLADKWDICMMILGFAGAIIKGVTVPLMFYLFGSVLEAYGNNKTDRVAMASEIFRYLDLTDTVMQVAVYYLYLGLTSVVAGFFETACFIYSAQRQSTRLRRKYLEAILIQEVGYFDTEANTAAIIDCITEKIIDYQDATGEKIGHFFFNVTTAVGSVGLAFFLCWQLALLTFLVLPSVTMTGGFYTLVLANLARKSQFAYQNADSIVYETVSNIRTVYSYVGEMKANKDFSDALVDTVKLGSRAGMAKGVGLGMLNGTMNASWGMMFWIGAILVSKGQADRTGVIISIFCIIYGGLCLGLAVPDIEAMGKGRRAAYPIFEIIERVPKVKDGTKPRNLARVHGKIELQNVHFFYPSRPEAPIFTGLSLTVPAGKAVALVGSSGSGKSTIISLISRFFDPLKGKILVDGHDITQVSIHSLRSNIGLVGQEPALFTTTIHENILMGRPNATDDEVEAAAKVANIHSFISKLPNGYATQVGDRGTQLSGGQKQRIAIARAVLKDPAILLLDEATSALDAESERVIQDALDVLMLARTSVTVAHKLSTIQNVDHIAVLECGELREWGSHNELMLKGPSGVYFNLHQCQDAKRSEDIEKFTPPQQQQTTPRPSLTRSNSGNRGLMLLAGGDSSASFVALDFPTTPTGQSMSDEIRRHSDFLTPRSSVSFSNKADAYLGPNFTQDILKAATALEAAAARDSTLTRLYKLALTEWKRIVLGCLGSVSAGCVKPVFSILMVQAATSLYKREDQVQDAVSKWAIILACLAVYSVITSSIEHAFFGQAGERITKSVRERVFYSVLRNEVGWFDLEDNSSAHITGRLATDAASINTAIAKQLSSAVNNISSVLFAIGVGFVYDWKMTLVSIALLPCWLISGVVRYKSTLGYAHVLRTAHESASSFAVQAVTNIRTVASFTLETRIIDTLNQVLQEPLRNGRKHAIETGSANGGGFALSQLGNGLSLFYLTAAIRTDNADFIALFTVFQVMCNTAAFLSELLAIIPQFARVRDGVNSVFEVMDRSTEIDPDKAGSKRPDSGLVGKIQFRGVHFRYPLRPDVPVLRDLSLKIEAGEYFALVGESGSGKSSCIALIERFYDVSAGLVLIDGVDVRDYNLSWLREQIGLVQQEPYLLRCSVRENIAYGGHYSEAQVIQAAKAANAHTFISALPQGYDTDVGDRGSLLSGGQKQRVAIARAVLKNPRILLLDEATSALDANSERIVQNALDCLMVGKTTLVIAHRLSTIRHANTIVVMKAGRAVEQGNHDKLMLITSGHYANLVASQDHQREGDRV